MALSTACLPEYHASGRRRNTATTRWSLRGFESFLMDLADNTAFCEELIENVADWIARSIERLLEMPLDAVIFTDDYADQRGMIFGLERFRKLFKPHWRRLFDIVHRAGFYSVLHVCENAEPALQDLIECGPDCLESLQPEAMDIYGLKKKYGTHLRFWAGRAEDIHFWHIHPDPGKQRERGREMACRAFVALSDHGDRFGQATSRVCTDNMCASRAEPSRTTNSALEATQNHQGILPSSLSVGYGARRRR
jgi:hypothetical protein